MKSALVVMATGTGKTVVMGTLVKQFPRHRGRVLMIAHREELITQAAEKFSRVCGEEVGIEMADRVVKEWHADKPRIVVASVQTLNAGNKTPRYEKFDPMEFGLLMDDEAHHSPSASYRRIHNHFAQNPGCVHVGVTATPDRTDNVAMGSVFETVAFQYPILQAIDDGWLVPVEQQFVEIEGLDLSNCKSDKRDLKDKAVAEVMERDENLFAVADATRQMAAGRKTIVFASSVAHAHRIADILNGYEGHSAAAIDGTTDKMDRRRILSRFAAGDIRYLLNCAVLTEGYDEPTVEVVAMARPTKSRSLYSQMLGRGTRVLPGLVEDLIDPVARRSAIAGSAKSQCTVLDFVGNSGRHKLVCSADILGGDDPPEVVARATRNAKARKKPADMQEELELARKEVADEKRRAEEASLTPTAKFRTQSVNPFDSYDVVSGRSLSSNGAMEWLERQGVNKKWLSKATAAEMESVMKNIRHRQAAGLATVKQCNLLKRSGISGHNLTKNQASQLIDAIVQNRWKAPASVMEKASGWGALIGK